MNEQTENETIESEKIDSEKIESEKVENDKAVNGDKIDKPTYFIHLMFFLYFLILTGERLYSIIGTLSVAGLLLFNNPFYAFVYEAASISIAVTYCFIFVYCRGIFLAPTTFSAKAHNSIEDDKLCYAAGMLLVSGMVHTNYTVSYIQFIAYGALIVAMIIRTAVNAKAERNKPLLWLSLAYLVAFSMAIPVMYPSEIELYKFFYFAEAGTMIALVVCFTVMLLKVFGGTATDLFSVIPIAIAVVGDSLILGLSWHNELNTFVLIFLCVSAALFISGIVFKLVNKLRGKSRMAR